MKKNIIIFFFTNHVVCNNLHAESEQPLVNTLNINILSPGIGGEIRIAQKGTIKLDGGVGFGFT